MFDCEIDEYIKTKIDQINTKNNYFDFYVWILIKIYILKIDYCNNKYNNLGTIIKQPQNKSNLKYEIKYTLFMNDQKKYLQILNLIKI